MWYDVNKTLSHNCLWNFVVGPRGVGKTYSCKKRVIKDNLNKGDQFVYLRRYDTEIKASQIGKFFDDIAGEFEGHDFAVKHGTFYIDKVEAGFSLCLSKAAQFKSVPFPRVTTIIFDEFIIDQGMIRYLPQEVQTFCEMYSTISRLRDVRVLFLSNAITFTNPYFLYFDISLQQGQTIWKRGEILVELVKNDSYKEKVEKTRFGSIIAGTAYGAYNMENEFLRDDDRFIQKLPSNARPIMTLEIEDKVYGVYGETWTDIWYVSKKVDRTCKNVVSLDSSSHDVGSVYKGSTLAKGWIIELQQKYYRALVRFDDMNAKNLIAKAISNI